MNSHRQYAQMSQLCKSGPKIQLEDNLKHAIDVTKEEPLGLNHLHLRGAQM